ncbi:DUF975 family protein [Streptococcus chenjunshii]|uniref:DUF975 family protein n=1 Tax=Streptococcus chenjunshii TaxID=2173853 RepID=A0A372KNL8_9STRE|nr:DUF975 family protein [Streptococcus chenjunshii]AXQ77953.1 DUF975 family protein [Streptococcus chenjunshii]RFU51803.1 DUF975 family protein [Streptococcus chenjunshii]RFU53891.1 DUF975 family protein [Streptococcus chenjunshii]
MKTRKELKDEAKAALSGNWGWAAALSIIPYLLLMLTFFMIISLLGLFSYAGGSNESTELIGVSFFLIIAVYILFLLAFFGISVSISSSFLDLVRGKKDELMSAATYGFRQGRYGKFFANSLMVAIFIYLWSLLFTIPGLIKTYSYALSTYIVKDDLEQGRPMSATSAITKSRQLMDGHKWDLFVLELSFLGWQILASLTLGIGYIWLTPYISATYAAFYDDLVQNQQPA